MTQNRQNHQSSVPLIDSWCNYSHKWNFTKADLPHAVCENLCVKTARWLRYFVEKFSKLSYGSLLRGIITAQRLMFLLFSPILCFLNGSLMLSTLRKGVHVMGNNLWTKFIFDFLRETYIAHVFEMVTLIQRLFFRFSSPFLSPQKAIKTLISLPHRDLFPMTKV